MIPGTPPVLALPQFALRGPLDSSSCAPPQATLEHVGREPCSSCFLFEFFESHGANGRKMTVSIPSVGLTADTLAESCVVSIGCHVTVNCYGFVASVLRWFEGCFGGLELCSHFKHAGLLGKCWTLMGESKTTLLVTFIVSIGLPTHICHKNFHNA